jgi:hypothetical protein
MLDSLATKSAASVFLDTYHIPAPEELTVRSTRRATRVQTVAHTKNTCSGLSWSGDRLPRLALRRWVNICGVVVYLGSRAVGTGKGLEEHREE